MKPKPIPTKHKPAGLRSLSPEPAPKPVTRTSLPLPEALRDWTLNVETLLARCLSLDETNKQVLAELQELGGELRGE